jgi:hypothetical protein
MRSSSYPCLRYCVTLHQEEDGQGSGNAHLRHGWLYTAKGHAGASPRRVITSTPMAHPVSRKEMARPRVAPAPEGLQPLVLKDLLLHRTWHTPGDMDIRV